MVQEAFFCGDAVKVHALRVVVSMDDNRFDIRFTVTVDWRRPMQFSACSPISIGDNFPWLSCDV